MAQVNLLGIIFVSFDELAKGSGVSAAKLQKAVGEAGLDVRKFGNKSFVKKVDFEGWLREDAGKDAMAKQRAIERGEA